MAAINIETVLIELLPALTLTFVYQLFFRTRRNRFVEAFIIMVYLKSISFFVFNIAFGQEVVPAYFDSTTSNTEFGWVVVQDFLFILASSLQEYLTWVMISFWAVIFGLLVLFLKLSLQDPLKRRFSNVIRRVIGREPETDQYSGLRDRMNHLTFEGVEAQPLDPEVTKRAYSESWRDYLLIGLVTLLPSIAVYQSVPPELFYASGVIIFLTWIYRFGYTSSNRIAKGAGVSLGDRDVGSEMMRGVLGWFFRLNLIFSLFTLIIPLQWFIPTLGAPPTILDFFGVGATTSESAFIYFFYGILQALPPIAFAILILPLTEDFAIHLYKEFFESITKARTKISGIDWKGALLNIGGSLVTAGLAIGAFLGAVVASTLVYSGGSSFFPGQVTPNVMGSLESAPSNASLFSPINWALLMLIIPFAIMILVGVIGHYIRSRVGGSIETFAVITGIVVSVGVWLLLPGLDYILDTRVTPVQMGDTTIYHLRPFVTTTSEVFARLASQYIISLPLYIFTALFVMYFFMFRDSWKKETGEEMAPLLSVHQRDIADVIVMFFAGLIASIVGVFVLSILLDPGFFEGTILSLIDEIALADGLEGYLESITGAFVIIAEHNIVRTLLMLIIGPVFWSAVLWLVAVKKEKTETNVGYYGLLTTVIAIIVTAVWTFFDLAQGLNFFSPTAPWGFGAELGIRGLVVIGILIGAHVLIILFRKITGKGTGVWWFPAVVAFIALEYFVYDDQFTMIAVIILPMIIAAVYKGLLSSRAEVANEDLLVAYMRFSLMAVAIAEVLSTALLLGGISVIYIVSGENVLVFLAGILPHGVIEIPAFLFAAAASIRIARNLAPSLQQEDWESIPSKTRELLTDERTWRGYILIIFFLILAALIEVSVTQLIIDLVRLG